MSLNLPEPVAAYFAADLVSANCFHPEGVVHDEGSIYRGRDAIREWREESTRKYNCSTQPFAVEQRGQQWLVRSRVSGDFPGSPADLQFSFRLMDNQIVELQIS